MLLVTYDLRQPGRDYSKLYEFLKGYGWARVAESVWLLKSSETPASMRDNIKAHVDPDDLIFVIQVRQSWGSFNASAKVADWLKNDVNWK